MNRFVRIIGPLIGGVLIIAAGLTAALLRFPSAVAAEPAITAAGGNGAQWGLIAAALAADSLLSGQASRWPGWEARLLELSQKSLNFSGACSYLWVSRKVSRFMASSWRS